MSDEPIVDSAQEQRLNHVIAQYLRAVHAGEQPSREDLLARHPELASEMREFFAAHDQVHQAVAAVGRPSSEGGPAQAAVDGSLAPTDDRVDTSADAARQAPDSARQLVSAGSVPGYEIAGRYRIIEHLGSGAMGTVFKAQDTKMDRFVAIKLLPPQSLADPDAVARFEREAKALAKLAHPNIVQAYDSGEDRGQHYLVMEYVEGTNLGQLLRTRGRIAPTLAADYAYQIALGLEHAHQKRLIHRDLKPGNLLVATSSPAPSPPFQGGAGGGYQGGAGGAVKILDLGLARFLQDQIRDATLTREGTGLGTPDYMAPEQFRSARHVDARSDIYSLGCTLYHFLTGHVPFPGSSFSEKYAAHEERDPAPLEHSCPEVPAGLALVVRRMMAKRPADRFQSAREVAEALAPYVAGSSQAIFQIQATASWHGSQLSISVQPLRRRRRVALVATATAALAIVGIAFVFALLFRSEPIPRGTTPTEVSGEEPEKKRSEPGDPNVLTVAQDGSAQFESINAALKQIKPGMTIRVLDDATYREKLLIGYRESHRGITIESSNRATIEVAGIPGQPSGIVIVGVPSVTIRGFRLRAQGPQQTLVLVKGPAPGLLLENLEMEAGAGIGPDYDGVLFYGVSNQEEAPCVLQNCTFRQPRIGVTIAALTEDYQTPNPCTRIVIRNNTVIEPSAYGVLVRGVASQIQIVGNKIYGATILPALQLDKLVNASDILIANNTLFKCTTAFRLWDGKVQGERIQFSNNLILGSLEPDMVFVDSGGTNFEIKGPGDGRLVLDKWQLSHNWREVQEPKGESLAEKSWIPPGPADVRKDQIDVISRVAGDADFLRPAAGSPLATAGVGGKDLPSYVGAVPPSEVEPWDWQKTWDERHPKMLLTVSKEPKSGGEFRSINDALAKVDRHGMTIRVMDNETYSEAIPIRDRTHQEALTLEAAARATLMVPAQEGFAITVIAVPRVTVRGFTFRLDQPNVTSIGVGGLSPGTVLDGLEFESNQLFNNPPLAVSLDRIPLTRGDDPVIVQNCTFRGFLGGIKVFAMEATSRQISPCRRVIIRNNRFFDTAGAIWVVGGRVEELYIVSNTIWNFTEFGIRIGEIFEGSGAILIANNTVRGQHRCVEMMEPIGDPRAVAIQNNFLLAGRGPDLAFVGKNSASLKSWSINHNGRQVRAPDSAATEASEWIPSSDDVVLDKNELMSFDPQDNDFLRPAKDSPLATAGAGDGLPEYVGAVPPEGVDPWDWDRTWRAWATKPRDTQPK